jgi:hypothetical protein
MLLPHPFLPTRVRVAHDWPTFQTLHYHEVFEKG